MSDPAPSPGRPPLLAVRALSVDVGPKRAARRAVDGVSFEIAPGELLALVGESGAGKSLTGAALVGLHAPARTVAGSVHWRGTRVDFNDTSALRRLRGREIAFVFQDAAGALNPLHRVGRQLVETIRHALGLDAAAARRRALALLADVGFADAAGRLDDHPHQFSGGERQRIGIALALAGEPGLIVADEPTSALDATVQLQVLALLQRLCRERGVAVLLITHDLRAVLAVCDRVAVMYAGRLVEVGTPRGVLQTGAHPYTEALVRALPRLDAPLAELRAIDGVPPRPGDATAGCAFHPRCSRRLPRCGSERPPLAATATGTAACWLLQRTAMSPAAPA